MSAVSPSPGSFSPGRKTPPGVSAPSTGLRPLWIIIAITVGGTVGGVLGMFLGVPIVAFLRYLMNRLIQHRLRKKNYKDAESLTLE